MTPTQPNPRGGHDRWLVSYADLVTLLLAFFTTLYTASTVDATKLGPLSSSLQRAFDGPAGASVVQPAGGPAIVPPIGEVAPPVSALEHLRQQLDAALATAVAERRVEVIQDPRGIVVSMPEEAAFPVGSSDVTLAAQDLIRVIGDNVRGLPNTLRIEGHTDDVPIRTSRYRSNWELSTARASAVVAYMIQQVGVEPGRLAAAGYGEFHPRVANDSPSNRARNRRIDIVILDARAR